MSPSALNNRSTCQRWYWHVIFYKSMFECLREIFFCRKRISQQVDLNNMISYNRFCLGSDLASCYVTCCHMNRSNAHSVCVSGGGKSARKLSLVTCKQVCGVSQRLLFMV